MLGSQPTSSDLHIDPEIQRAPRILPGGPCRRSARPLTAASYPAFGSAIPHFSQTFIIRPRGLKTILQIRSPPHVHWPAVFRTWPLERLASLAPCGFSAMLTVPSFHNRIY